MAEVDEAAATLAVVVARLDDVREDIRDLRTDLSAHRIEMVSRGEWEMRNRAVDNRFDSQGREIAELKAARAPWWSWASVLVASAAFAWAILGPVIGS
ncbi:hypothetical protein [Microbacterium sp. J1-1]|uniref:hypothetical protein n=1 Tax=Microbacterium sp. J1-1 TaxID=2992441 RepID=UPI00211529A1|nr:hypothetical protein [Microbacterium sp. J1-1]UUE19897.1 hypothetical protein LRQ07_14015 [Microbacterium sp. J1-1]